MNRIALLIIDMQKGSFTEETPRYAQDQVIEHINELSEVFRDLLQPVIFIQHDGQLENDFIPNTLRWEILDQIEVKKTDLILSKTANDAFYNSQLFDHLRENKITELVISGCATDFCVASTIQSALSKDFDLTIISDAHTTGDRPSLTAKQVIDHYNWKWDNMIPSFGKVRLRNTRDFITAYERHE